MNLSFSYSNMMTEYTFYNDGNNLILEGDFGYMKYNNKTYFSSEVLFFSPSLHTFSNRHLPLELQLIHHDDNGKKLSISILFKYSKKDYSLLLGSLGFDKSELLHQQAFKPKTFKKEINFSKYIKSGKDFLMYQGKDAKPPCETETTYFLLTDILKVSKKQLDNFPLLIRNNNRIIQKRLDRKIFSNFKPENMEKKLKLIKENVKKIQKLKEEELKIKKIDEQKRREAMEENKKLANKTKSSKKNITVDINRILNSSLYNITALNKTSDKYKAIQKEINRITHKNQRNDTKIKPCKAEDKNIPIETVQQKAKSVDEYIKSNYPKFIANFDIDKNQTLKIDRDIPLSKSEIIRKSLNEKYKVWKRLYEQTTKPSAKVDAKAFIQMKSLEMEFKRNNYEPYLNERKLTKDDLFLSFVQLDPNMFPETSYLESKKRMNTEELDKILTNHEDIDKFVDNFVDEIEKNSLTLNKAEKKLKIQQDQLHYMQLKKISDMKTLINQELEDKKNKKKGSTFTIKMRKMKNGQKEIKPNKHSIINDLAKDDFKNDDDDDDDEKTVNGIVKKVKAIKLPLKVVTDDEENKEDMEKIKARYLKGGNVNTKENNDEEKTVSKKIASGVKLESEKEKKEIRKPVKTVKRVEVAKKNKNENTDDNLKTISDDELSQEEVDKIKQRFMTRSQNPFEAVFDDLEKEKNGKSPVEEAKKLIKKSNTISKKIKEIKKNKTETIKYQIKAEQSKPEKKKCMKKKKNTAKVINSTKGANSTNSADVSKATKVAKAIKAAKAAKAVENKKNKTPSKPVIKNAADATKLLKNILNKPRISKPLEPIVNESPKNINLENLIKPKTAKNPIEPIVSGISKRAPLEPIVSNNSNNQQSSMSNQAMKSYKANKQSLQSIVNESVKRAPLEPVINVANKRSPLERIINDIPAPQPRFSFNPSQGIKTPRVPLKPIISDAPARTHLQPVINDYPTAAPQPRFSFNPTEGIRTPRVPLQPIINNTPEGTHLQPIINEYTAPSPKFKSYPTQGIKPARVPLQPIINNTPEGTHLQPIINDIPISPAPTPAPQPKINPISNSASNIPDSEESIEQMIKLQQEKLLKLQQAYKAMHKKANQKKQQVVVVKPAIITPVEKISPPKKEIEEPSPKFDWHPTVKRPYINEVHFNLPLKTKSLKKKAESIVSLDAVTDLQKSLINEKLLRYKQLRASFNKSVVHTKTEYLHIKPRKERHDELTSRSEELTNRLERENEMSEKLSKYGVISPDEMESRKTISKSLSKYQKMKNTVDVLSHSMKVKNLKIGSYDYIKDIQEKSKKNKERKTERINHSPVREVFDTNLDYDMKVFSSIKLVLNNLSTEFKKLDLINERLYKNTNADFLTEDGYIRFTKKNLSLIVRKAIALQDDSDSEMISLSFDDKLNRLYDYSYKTLIAQNKNIKQNNIYFDSTEVDQNGLKKVVEEVLKKNDFTGKPIKYSSFDQKSINNLVFTVLKKLPIMLLKISSKVKLNVSNVNNVASTYEEADYDPFITKKNAKFLKKDEMVMGPKKQEELDKQVKSQPGQGRKAVRKDGKVEKTEIFNTLTWPDACK
jgi:carbonic anhydrase